MKFILVIILGLSFANTTVHGADLPKIGGIGVEDLVYFNGDYYLGVASNLYRTPGAYTSQFEKDNAFIPKGSKIADIQVMRSYLGSYNHGYTNGFGFVVVYFMTPQNTFHEMELSTGFIYQSSLCLGDEWVTEHTLLNYDEASLAKQLNKRIRIPVSVNTLSNLKKNFDCYAKGELSSKEITQISKTLAQEISKEPGIKQIMDIRLTSGRNYPNSDNEPRLILAKILFAKSDNHLYSTYIRFDENFQVRQTQLQATVLFKDQSRMTKIFNETLK